MKSWSFSSLTEYEKCPHSISFPYDSNEIYVPNEPAARGIKIHADCADYINGKKVTLLKGFDWPSIKGSISEQKFGLDINWQPVPYSEACFKFIPDALILEDTSITIIDFKTGKRDYNELKHASQMQFYATAMLSTYPDTTSIASELWYLDIPFIKRTEYTVNKLGAIRIRQHNRALKMMNDEKLDPKPSKSNCRFCRHAEKCEFTYDAN